MQRLAAAFAANNAAAAAGGEGDADPNLKLLQEVLLRGLRSQCLLEFRPLPSSTIVKLSIIEGLRAMHDSRPHIGGVADYLQYAMFAGLGVDGLDGEYSISTAVRDKPSTAAVSKLPPLVAELVDKVSQKIPTVHYESLHFPASHLISAETDRRIGCVLSALRPVEPAPLPRAPPPDRRPAGRPRHPARRHAPRVGLQVPPPPPPP